MVITFLAIMVIILLLIIVFIDISDKASFYVGVATGILFSMSIVATYIQALGN